MYVSVCLCVNINMYVYQLIPSTHCYYAQHNYVLLDKNNYST